MLLNRAVHTQKQPQRQLPHCQDETQPCQALQSKAQARATGNAPRTSSSPKKAGCAHEKGIRKNVRDPCHYAPRSTLHSCHSPLPFAGFSLALESSVPWGSRVCCTRGSSLAQRTTPQCSASEGTRQQTPSTPPSYRCGGRCVGRACRATDLKQTRLKCTCVVASNAMRTSQARWHGVHAVSNSVTKQPVELEPAGTTCMNISFIQDCFS